MIGYRDMTFCTGAGCTKFDGCFRAYTKQVRDDANAWWGGPDAPVTLYVNPMILECYTPQATPQVTPQDAEITTPEDASN